MHSYSCTKHLYINVSISIDSKSPSQIPKTIGAASSRHHSDTIVSDRGPIDDDAIIVAIWGHVQTRNIDTLSTVRMFVGGSWERELGYDRHILNDA